MNVYDDLLGISESAQVNAAFPRMESRVRETVLTGQALPGPLLSGGATGDAK